MRRNFFGILGLALVFLVFGTAHLNANMSEKNIVETAVAAGSFSTLVTAVKAAGLVETLSGEGPFTVFAPTDDAFAKLPEGTVEALLKDKEKLTAILTYHVVAGKVMAKDVVSLTSAKTVNGQSLTIMVKDESVMIDGAKVVKTDIVCSNGVIHVIDAVVLPK
jgi:uncharacterized surface protein with fasciclin (FAS1) repeats